MTNHNRGTTIVELTLYMGLLSIFILILFDLFSTILSSQTRSTSVALIQINGNFLLTKLTQDINQSSLIITPANIGDSSALLVIRVGTTNASFSVSNGRLVLVDSSGSYNLNDSDTTISTFSATRVGNSGGKPGVSLTFTLTSNVVDHSNIKSKTFNTFIVGR